MKKVKVYKARNGAYEEDRNRAVAWDLVQIAKDMNMTRGDLLSFSAALWIVENYNLVKETIEQQPKLKVRGCALSRRKGLIRDT